MQILIQEVQGEAKEGYMYNKFPGEARAIIVPSHLEQHSSEEYFYQQRSQARSSPCRLYDRVTYFRISQLISKLRSQFISVDGQESGPYL